MLVNMKLKIRAHSFFAMAGADVDWDSAAAGVGALEPDSTVASW